MSMFGFGKNKKRTPAEQLNKVRVDMDALLAPQPRAQVVEDCARHLAQTKTMLLGDGPEATPSPSDVAGLARGACEGDFMGKLLSVLPKLPFEAEKDAAIVWGNLVLAEAEGGVRPAAAHVASRPDLVASLIGAYRTAAALQCGLALHESLGAPEVAEAVLRSPSFFELFRLMELDNFEVAGDAFTSFREALTRHPDVAAAFLAERYDAFFLEYGNLLSSGNYVTRRQSLKLLSELLMEKANAGARDRYIASAENLKVAMISLRDASRGIQYEAFHVFKVFVANPRKSPAVLELLFQNKDKLLAYLADFQTDRDEDSFKEEKQVLLNEIARLQLPR